VKGWAPKWKLGLTGKAALALALAALLPLALAAFRLIQVNRRAFTEQVLSLHAVAAAATADRVAAFLAARRSLTVTAANHPGLYLDPQSEAARLFLTDLLSAPHGMETMAIVLVNQDDEELIRAQRRDSGRQANRLFWTYRQTEPVLVQDDGQLWLVVSAATPRNVGWLRMIFNADELLAALRPEETGRNAHLALGGVAEDALFGTAHDAGQAPPDLLAHAASGKISGAGQYATRSGDKALGAYAPVAGAGWFVMSWQPIAVAEAISVVMRRRSFEAVALAVILTAVLAAMAFYTVARPLRAMVLAQGELTGFKPGAGDEIDQLKASFEALGRSLREREALDQISLGRYQIVRRLGQGAMGTVFEAWDPKLQRSIALKTIRFDQYVASEEKSKLVNRLLHEAITAGRVNHANVVSVFDLESSDEVAFVAMELMDGASLEDYLKGGRMLSPAETAAIGLEIARGLAAAHAREVIHRDIKPANVLLGRDNSVKVADFGLSEFVSNLAGQRDAIFGTPGYIPPETLGGAGFSASGDMFALGVLLYRCVTGAQPFAGGNNMQTMVATISKNPEPPIKLRPEMPEGMNDLILRMLSRKKEVRPSAAEAVAELETYAKDVRWVFHEAPGTSKENEDDMALPSQFLDTVRVSGPSSEGG